MNRGYRELRVWQEAKALAVDTYRLIQNAPELKRDFGLRDQMQRAAVSIPSNIAEGEARKSNKDSIRFFHIALGSAAELSTQFEIARELNFIDVQTCDAMVDRLDDFSRSLGALIKSRQ